MRGSVAVNKLYTLTYEGKIRTLVASVIGTGFVIRDCDLLIVE